MIIVNGYIKTAVESSTETEDAYGFPVESNTTFSTTKIKCQYVLSNDLLAETKEGSPYSRKTATIYIDLQPFKSERIRLYAKDDTLIGEFSVRSISELKAVRQVQIIV